MTLERPFHVQTRVGLHGWEAFAVRWALDRVAASAHVVLDEVEVPATVAVDADTATATFTAPVPWPAGLRLVDDAVAHAAGDSAPDATAASATAAGVVPDPEELSVQTAGADRFADVSEGGVPMRRYTPPTEGPHPLILFLHGGGESGSDNWAQLVGTWGAIALSEQYPDHVVLAPQAPPSQIPLMSPNVPFAERQLDADSGWSRACLGTVTDHVRALVRDGVVDPSRVFVTGVSMGGAGTLRALSVAPDLFVAAAPVCPTMTPETFGYLRSLQVPVWVSSAYVDHTPDRHKYLVDGVLELMAGGATDAHVTLFSPEQLRSVGIPSRDDLSLERLLSENHGSWALTYSGAEGITDWLVSRRR